MFRFITISPQEGLLTDLVTDGQHKYFIYLFEQNITMEITELQHTYFFFSQISAWLSSWEDQQYNNLSIYSGKKKKKKNQLHSQVSTEASFSWKVSVAP